MAKTTSSAVAELEKVLKDAEKIHKNNRNYASLLEANDFYNRMLSKGIIKKRGNRLRGIEDAHLLYPTID